MKHIGIISDTHGYWDPKYEYYLGQCDEVWHAGDIGTAEVADRFECLGPRFRAVWGNVDGYDLRRRYTETLRFRCEQVNVLMKHIGGYPGHYDPSVWKTITEETPQLFVAGHSHILKVMPDPRLHLLHINPGAAGLQGWQTQRTLVRLVIDGRDMRDCEVVTLGRRAPG